MISSDGANLMSQGPAKRWRTIEDVHVALELKAEGVEVFEIARRLECSEKSVRTILKAPWEYIERIKNRLAQAQARAHKRDAKELDDRKTYRDRAPIVRCGGCGGMVVMPCIKCRTDRGAALDDPSVEHPPHDDPNDPSPMEILSRAAAIRAKRTTALNPAVDATPHVREYFSKDLLRG